MMTIKEQDVMNFLQDFADSLLVTRNSLETEAEKMALDGAIRVFLHTSFRNNIIYWGAKPNASWRLVTGIRLKETRASWSVDSFWKEATGLSGGMG
jgi:hypothetical protein